MSKSRKGMEVVHHRNRKLARESDRPDEAWRGPRDLCEWIPKCGDMAAARFIVVIQPVAVNSGRSSLRKYWMNYLMPCPGAWGLPPITEAV